MPYKLPENIVPDTTLNLCVPIPNEPEYIQAFLASYSHLARWVAWERDGTQNAALAASVWLAAYNQLLDNWQGCQDTGDAEDMTTIINNYVSCSPCGSGTPTTIYCVNQEGGVDVTPQQPAPTTVPSPVGDDWPINVLQEEPPDGYDDWDTFDIEACAAANGMWQAIYAWITVLEGGIDTIVSLATALILLVPATALEVLSIIGGSGVYKLAVELVDLIVSEQASDILNEAKEWLEDEKETIVCTIFSYRHSIPMMQAEFVRMFYAHVGSVLTLNAQEQAAVYRLGQSLFPINLALAFFFEYDRYIDAQEPVDCSTCSNESGIYFMNLWATSFKLNGVNVEITNPGTYEGDQIIYGAIYELESQASGSYPWYGQHGCSFMLWAEDSGPTDVIMQVLDVSDYVPHSEPYPTGYPTEGYKLRIAAQSNLYAYYGQQIDGQSINLGNNDGGTAYQFAGAGSTSNFIVRFRFWPVGV